MKNYFTENTRDPLRGKLQEDGLVPDDKTTSSMKELVAQSQKGIQSLVQNQIIRIGTWNVCIQWRHS